MRFQRTAFGALAFAAILAGSAAFYLRDPPCPPDSVELMPAYHDPALLSRGWSLPVAHLYGPQGYMFQQNPSTCGPTSIADVLHSEGRQADPDSVMEGSLRLAFANVVDQLRSLRGPGESYSDVIVRLVAAFGGIGLACFQRGLFVAEDTHEIEPQNVGLFFQFLARVRCSSKCSMRCFATAIRTRIR